MLRQKYSVTVEDLGITIQTGTLAKQASGSVTIQLGETVVFVAATAAASLRNADQDFFPLTVDYREKYHAAGRFPGGFFKREGRPSEKEILTSRLCDRPLRPLFPTGFLNEVQVIGLLMSTDLVNESDILMVNGASAALLCSDIPWNGPIGCVRIGEINGEFVVNPTHQQQFESTLDLIYVGNENEMMMIEGAAEQISDDRFIEALEFAHVQTKKIIAAQHELAKQVNKQKKEFKLYTCQPEIIALVRDQFGPRLQNAVFNTPVKAERGAAVDAIKTEAAVAVKALVGEEKYDKNQVRLAFELLQEELYRAAILEHGKRADGRSPTDLRAIECQTSVLPRVHGSALFQRGETQNVAIVTLGTGQDVQELDGLTGGARQKSFILQYNFPPYSVGETGRFIGPGRREIGHGALAERSLLPIIPAEDDFPYTIRIVNEIMESNGSTSMASVCGGCLALMDAGVPITDMVAGISVGLVTETENGKITKHVILTDIIGAEDHFGDMDFKICGTRTGITGFQLDLKIHGLPFDIAKEAIRRNTEVRLQILDTMGQAMPEARKELNPNAPRIHSLEIDPEKIGALIGPGGKTIRRIQEVSGAHIDINDDNSGKVLVFAANEESLKRAVDEVILVTGDLEVGKAYLGTVRGVKEFGCFVECLPGKEGLVHISELADFRVRRTEDVCKIGDQMWVKCIGIDEKGRVRLSRRAAMADREGRPDATEGETITLVPPPEGSEDAEAPDRDEGSYGDRRGPRRTGGGGRGGDRGPRRERR